MQARLWSKEAETLGGASGHARMHARSLTRSLNFTLPTTNAGIELADEVPPRREEKEDVDAGERVVDWRDEHPIEDEEEPGQRERAILPIRDVLGGGRGREVGGW